MARRRRRYRRSKGNPGIALILLIVLAASFENLEVIIYVIGLAILALFLFGVYALFGEPLLWRLQSRQYLKLDLSEVDKLNGHEFERFLAPLFERQGYHATVTRGSGDFGADLVLKKDGITTIIQAKRYGENKKVGVKAVQEVVGALAFYNATEAVVVTNRYFTRQAENLAKANNVKLIDRDKLNSLINQYGEQPETQPVNP